MTVLEPAEQERRYAEKALAILEDDSSVRKFDEILRADQVAPEPEAPTFGNLFE
jgi:predicted aminopeptidase